MEQQDKKPSHTIQIISVITAIIVAYIGYLGVKYQVDSRSKETPSSEAAIKFVVLDKESGISITGATITLQIDVMPSETNVTDTEGVARFFLKPEYIGLHGFLQIDADGYKSQKRDIDIVEKKPYIIYLETENSGTAQIQSTPSSQPSTNSQNPENILHQGDEYYGKGDYAQAIIFYNEAIRLKPDYATAYFYRGDAYNSSNRYDEAISDYTKAIELKYNLLYLVYSKRGLCYYNKSNYDLAIDDFTQSITLKPDNAVAYLNRGYIYFQKGDKDKAFMDANVAIQLDASSTLAYYYRGWIYNDKGEYDKAIVDLSQAILLKPDYALAYNERAFAYKAKGYKEAAISDYKKVIEIAPSSKLAKDAEQKIKDMESAP